MTITAQTPSSTGSHALDATGYNNLDADLDRLLKEVFHFEGYAQQLRAWQRGEDSRRHEELRRLNSVLVLSFKRQWSASNVQLSVKMTSAVEQSVRLIIALITRLSSPRLVKISITDVNSVLFQIKYADKNAYLELFWDEDDADVELIYNLFENGSPLPAYGGSVQTTLSKFFEALNA